MGARYSLQFRPGAMEDLAAIRTFITDAAGRKRADAFIGKLLDHIEHFEHTPHRGTLHRAEDGLRVVGWRRTVTIAFVVNDAAREVAIVGVWYRGADVDRALRGR